MVKKLANIHGKGPADRTSEFADPANDTIPEYFEKSREWNPELGAYVPHAKPDLTGEVDRLILEAGIPDIGTKRVSLYGIPVVANSRGVIFAWTNGTHDVFLRLSKNSGDAACGEGARLDPTYPSRWLNFYIVRLGAGWREILKRWLIVSYSESLLL